MLGQQCQADHRGNVADWLVPHYTLYNKIQELMRICGRQERVSNLKSCNGMRISKKKCQIEGEQVIPARIVGACPQEARMPKILKNYHKN